MVSTLSDEPTIVLQYPGKKDKKSILTGPAAQLKKLETFGSEEGESRNRLIHGDNLPTLRALLKDPDVAGRVRLVYIDPPFGTGQEFNGSSEEVAYVDMRVGAEFLEFLRERLILLHEILSEDGSIYVHIDWKMGHYVKALMDEVFGPERFINDIARIKCNPKNFSRKGYGNIKDMILFYSKTENSVWNESWETMTEEEIQRLFPRVDDEGRRYTTTPLHAPGTTRQGPTGQEWKGKLPPKGRHWRYTPDKLDELDEEGLIEWSSTRNPRLKIYADEAHRNDEAGSTRRKKRQDIWEFKDPPYPIYPTEKNLDMLKVIIEASSNKGDLVLDAFCGSGTTLVAASQRGREWIGIDESLSAVDTARKRLKQVINASFDLYYAD